MTAAVGPSLDEMPTGMRPGAEGRAGQGVAGLGVECDGTSRCLLSRPVLPVTWATVRLFLHVTAATIWVGGQLTLAGLVPALRRGWPDAPKAAARRFNTIAWAAFCVLVGTGAWNVVAVHPDWSSPYGTTLIAKLTVVGMSGLAAFLHARARSRRGLAFFGALSGLTALGALFLGVLLAG